MIKELQDQLVYICTRLYNYNDKLQAEYLERVLISQIGCKTFVPFRDSHENELIGNDRTKKVYKADIERLNSNELSLLAVLYDGICKDEGISFEIGYAYSRGIPIFIINTDFIWYAMDDVEFTFDPIISYMATDYIHRYDIIPSDTFYDALVISQNQVFKEATNKIKNMLCSNKYLYLPIKQENKFDVFLDFGGGKYEYQINLANCLKDILSSKQIKVETAKRYININCDAGKIDIENMLSSSILVCFGDEVELNSGTAALIGLARGVNKTVILYESSNVQILGENGHQMKKNLMIDFSIDRVAKTKDQIISLVMEVLHV